MVQDALVRRTEPTGGIALRAKYALETYNSTGSGLQALTSFVFPGLGLEGGWGGNSAAGWFGLAPRDFPYEQVNGYNSSVVMACVNAIVAGFKQAPTRVYRTTAEGTKVELPSHRLAKLLRRPNTYYSRSKLLGAALTSYLIKGNAYIYKDKANEGVGATRALYWIPPFMITPKRPIDGSLYVSHYEYNVDGKTYRLRPDQIIHLKWELDPYNTLMGVSPLQPVLSTIFSDEEADRFTSALLRNTAIPGVTIIPDTDKVKVKPEDAEVIKEAFKRKFGGDNRGEPMVLSFAAKVEQMGFNPEQLQMKDARRLPEERVSAQYRIAASFAGLGAGLDRSTYSNFEQAEKKSYETGIVPIWDEWGDDFTTAFNAEFFTSDDSYSLEFDYSKVKALSENADAVATRSSKIWTLGGIDRAEYRSVNGYPVDEARDANVWYYQLRAQANPITGGLPPANGNGDKKSLATRIRERLLLKASPSANLDTAYDMTLEADVSEIVRVMENELEDTFGELGEKTSSAARTMDRDNPEAETDRIVGDVLKSMGIAAALASIWARMGEEVEDGVRISVALRLAVAYGDVWNDGASMAAKSALRQAVGSYEAALREQTRKAVLEAIKGAAQGEGIDTIARRIKGMVSGRGMYPGIYDEAYKVARDAGATEEQAARAGEAKARRYRANLIAEAETRTYQNVVALESMQASGVVDKVRVVDGSACGWRYHDDTDRADGTTRHLSEARRYPTVHPRCKRRFFPVK
jgi:HK97 family phage portal protein